VHLLQSTASVLADVVPDDTTSQWHLNQAAT